MVVHFRTDLVFREGEGFWSDAGFEVFKSLPSCRICNVELWACSWDCFAAGISVFPAVMYLCFGIAVQYLQGHLKFHQVIGLLVIAYAKYMGVIHLETIFFVEPDGPVVSFPDPQPYIG